MAVSLPPDFIRMMQEQYGSDAACALFHALLETEPEVSVRYSIILSLTTNTHISAIHVI